MIMSKTYSDYMFSVVICLTASNKSTDIFISGGKKTSRASSQEAKRFFSMLLVFSVPYPV